MRANTQNAWYGGPWLAAALLLSVGACSSPEKQEQGGAARGALSRPSSPAVQPWARLIPWGAGQDQVGLRPRRPDTLAQGVSAVGLGPGGDVFLLDRLNRRVLRVAAGQDHLQVAAPVPEDTEDLAVSTDGDGLAAYSPLRARVWIYKNHEPAGELAVPRLFTMVRHISLHHSRVVKLHNAMQETFTLGSPSAPQLLEASLHSKQEGAFFLADGTGLAVKLLPGGFPEVRLLAHTAGRTAIKRKHRLSRPVLAARLVGAAAGLTCLRLEQDVSGAGRGPLRVERQVHCLDARSGRRVLAKSLPAPGLYLPRQELALGGSPPLLAFIHPRPKGLHLQVWPLPRQVQGGKR